MLRYEMFGYWGNSDMNVYECGTHSCDPGFLMDERFLRKNNIVHFIVSGRGKLRLANRQYELSAGEGFFIPAYTPAFYQADEKDPWLYCWVIFGGVKASSYLQMAQINLHHPVFSCTDPEFYHKTIEFMMALAGQHATLSEPKLFSFCYDVFARLIADNHSRHYTTPPDFRLETYIEKAIALMRDKYSQPLQVTDIAAHVGLNSNYFGSLFQHYIGISPQGYLITLRMQQARSLLSETDLSIQDIASRVGYPSPISFSRAFSKLFNIAPRAYRAAYFAGNLNLPDHLPFMPAWHNQPEGDN